MDATGLIAGLLLGAGVAAQIGYWLGKRRSRGEVAVVEAAKNLRDATSGMELIVESDPDQELFADVAEQWEALEEALGAIEPAPATGEADFTEPEISL